MPFILQDVLISQSLAIMGTRTFSRSLSLNLKPLSDNDLIKDKPNPTIVRITPYLSLGSETDAAQILLLLTEVHNTLMPSPAGPITWRDTFVVFWSPTHNLNKTCQ